MTTSTSLMATAFCVASGIAIMAQTVTVNFDKDEPGKPPSGFSFVLTGEGRPGTWVVRREDPEHGNVLVQTDTDTSNFRFPIAFYNEFMAANVTASMQFKPLSGKGDQAAGIVWRYRDKNNYYVTRCNALEDDCSIYRVIEGRRRPFQSKHTKVASNVWHTLVLEATDDRFVVKYDGTQVLDARDYTFKEAGKVGLWTKADSIIAFDNFTVSGR
jgi:3-keto-disaccharide hydrolase